MTDNRRQTDDQIRQKYETELGFEFGGLFWHLWNRYANARLAYEELIFLFGEEHHADELASLGSTFTADILRIFSQSLILHIARLTDPAATGWYRNISIQAIPQHLGNNDLLRAEVEELIAIAHEKTEFAREQRNKYIAHNDLLAADYPTHMNVFTEILPNSRTAIASIHAVLARVALVLLDEGWVDMLSYPPRAGAVIARIKILKDVARFVDSRIEPTDGRASSYVEAFHEAFEVPANARHQSQRVAMGLCKIRKHGF